MIGNCSCGFHYLQDLRKKNLILDIPVIPLSGQRLQEWGSIHGIAKTWRHHAPDKTIGQVEILLFTSERTSRLKEVSC